MKTMLAGDSKAGKGENSMRMSSCYSIIFMFSLTRLQKYKRLTMPYMIVKFNVSYDNGANLSQCHLLP